MQKRFLSAEKIESFCKRIKAKLYTAFLSSDFYKIGKGSTIIPPLRYKNLFNIQIGNDVLIHSNCWINAPNAFGNKSSPALIIQDHVRIGMEATISAANKIVIEEHVLLARNVYISDHGHEFHNINMPISQQGIRKVSEIRIGAGTWIGQNAVILPGSKIGRSCVVGANSVVSSIIPDYSVVAGIPAKIIEKYDEAEGKWIADFGNE
jgi:acetyltransferase-like isoleucine patch superfamily enzyme